MHNSLRHLGGTVLKIDVIVESLGEFKTFFLRTIRIDYGDRVVVVVPAQV